MKEALWNLLQYATVFCFLLSCVKVYRGSRYCISSIRHHPQILAVASDWRNAVFFHIFFILASSRRGKVQCTNTLVGKWCNSTHLTSVDPFFLKPYATSVVSSNKHNTATLQCVQILSCPLVASMLPQWNLHLSLLLLHPQHATSITISIQNLFLTKVDWRKYLARMIATSGSRHQLN